MDQTIQAAIASSMSESAYALRANDGVIVYARPGLAKMFGYAPDEMIGHHVSMLNAPSDLSPEDRASEILRELAARGVWQGEVENRRKGGEPFWSRATVTTLDHPVHGKLYVSVHAEITAEKQAREEHLRLAERLHQASRLESLGLLAGGVAHDFNNILTCVLGNLDLACAALPADTPVRARLESARQAVLRAADLADQMLVYAGHAQFVLARVDLNDVLHETAALLAPRYPNVEVRLHLATPSPQVDGDATHVRRVAMNLLINAAEAIGDKGGAIDVETREETLTARELALGIVAAPLPPGRYVRLSIRDDGCGMGTRELHRVFDPFVTTKFAGRGLGLAVVLGIVRAHGGTVRVTSALGKGSRFDVLLPSESSSGHCRHGEPAQGPSTATTVAGSARGDTVLVVDDEPLVREVICAMLAAAGTPVVEARGGREALEQFEARGPDIAAVLLDVTMPEMSGPEVCSRLRALGATVPIILCSGYSEEDVKAASEASAADGFLRKPFVSSQLLAALQAAITSRG